MSHALLVSARFHDDRWHGAGEWPPSPARLFQALVAGGALPGALSAEHQAALAWLEALAPPVIAAPSACEGRGFTTFVPNNDLDALGGDPRRIGEIRAGKTIKPRLFDAEAALLYAWDFEASEDADRNAPTLCAVSECLYQFGRGVDMAYASAEILDPADAEARLAAHPGSIWRPAGENVGGGVQLRCPRRGTLRSLIDRHEDRRKRLEGGVLRQARQPQFRIFGYCCPPARLLFDLKPRDQQRRFQPWPLTRAAELATTIRDRAVHRLEQAIPADTAKIEGALIGRGATERDKALRVRIIPLPSIGSPNVDPSIRRLLVERPPDCPVHADDLSWAFSGLNLAVDYATGHDGQPVLAPADDRSMLRHYGANGDAPARTWRTITPAALPIHRPRGPVGGAARYANEANAEHVVRQALRHAGIPIPVETIRVQREPFLGKGAPAEAFAEGSRFPTARLWHVEITFSKRVSGPLIIGDGRYCGLGIMAPVIGDHRDALILWIRIDQRPLIAHRAEVIRALRRALMSRAADADGHIPMLFSGHEMGPGPAQSGHHRHMYLFADDSDGDGLLDRIGVIAPWRVDRSWTPRREDRLLFENVVCDLRTVRAGAEGVLVLEPARHPDADDPLFARARTWTSRTAYRPTLHARKSVDASATAACDLSRECLRRGLSRPAIEVTRIEIGPRGGVRAEARLQFKVAVPGPIMLGHDAHCGGGLFASRC